MNDRVYKEYAGKTGTYSFYIKTIKGFKKYIGWLEGDTFRKDVNLDHKFEKAKAIGIDYGIIYYLDEAKCKKVILRDAPFRTFSISYEGFKKHGFKYPTDSNVVAKGRFQPQWMLAEKFWQIRFKGEIIQEAFVEKPGNNNLNLFTKDQL